MSRSLDHITTTTGAARRSPREEVSSNVIAALSAAIIRGGHVGAGWHVGAEPKPGGWVYTLTHQGAAISRCWLCRDAAHTDELWSEASGAAPDTTLLTKPGGVPWLAAEILPGALAAPEHLIAAGDLERCVAWALLESVQ